MVAHDGFAFIEDWWRDASPERDIPEEVLESIKESFRKPGVVEAPWDITGLAITHPCKTRDRWMPRSGSTPAR